MSKQLLDTPSRHPFSLWGLADKTWQLLCEGALNAAAVPAAKVAEAAGQLRIITEDTTYSFPADRQDTETGLHCELRVKSDVFWIRLCTMSDLGFSEAYMYGEVECDDLISIFTIFLRNREKLQNLDSRFSYLFSLPQKLTSLRFINTLSNSRSNISAHYDISNKMFEGFLSEDMTYSCAIFKDLDGDLKLPLEVDISSRNKAEVKHSLPTPTGTPNNELQADEFIHDDELYEAQIRKIDHIIRCARIEPGQRVLEIGSGWGSLAIRVATQLPGTTVDTITLSVHQQSLARERIARAGADISSRVRVHLLDYRALPTEWAGLFDRVISIEMVEAVGREYLEEYFRVVNWALKPGTGIGVIQSITIPEARFERYTSEVDFIRKWVSYVLFPGGFLPTLTLLVQALTAGSRGRLVVDSVSNIGPHYARTLREWRRRFTARFEDVIEPALREDYPDVMAGEKGRREIEVFRRKWICNCYCEIGFTTRSLGDHIITFTREGNESFECSIFQ
ncbi:cyclopropane-fatty-acyl-phospholipid synthase [Fomitiporia mediterranea MF3/22]|uniref:cyclopropane-fatty-acyl-phospholipid synthase n=1 Tax=Fomitiporia mediterranea (strain MF3/22) TaxID=694068 RepID=UPI0004407DD1|nr:cyclopropane-fatty-acyl-phospholipid synthase [Fomitiporia mediterranea MF3/22]EJC98988.1 cyclopropane-fatty-acyl-phospholipid synthase [Fomitiporia mediterranea MF3/22]